MRPTAPRQSGPVKVAAVQAAPVFLDAAATAEKTCGLIEEAARNGAQVVGFPEGFLPGHPGWLELIPAVGDLALGLYRDLFLAAVEVDGPEIARIRQACADTGTYAVLGINERRPHTTGTLFNTLLFLGPEGTLLHKHQKYVPTIGERLVHAPGQTGSRSAIRTPLGGLSGLICGENSNPLAQYAVALDYPVVHVAAWPQHFSPGLDMQGALLVASRGLAYSLKCFVLNCVAVTDRRMIDAYGIDPADRAFLEDCARRGGTSVIDPAGRIIAGPLGPGEAILYAEIDPADVIVPKSVHDIAGHYNRPELFAHLFGAARSEAAPDQPTEPGAPA